MAPIGNVDNWETLHELYILCTRFSLQVILQLCIFSQTFFISSIESRINSVGTQFISDDNLML